ncbi:hypothetical protein SAMN05421759_10511 [Roseivivax lentus]|uniref:Uncharacterized protein n=1 Tax=Roseivivax lentus TaxID=633194 RepID=A0A1N7MMY1_9RHOB|nr:hypothetical protein [Roseivivax lentus]SIS87368.1 hypothetical protein SAMN05421759_10511 [Roseivivax lentus]
MGKIIAAGIGLVVGAVGGMMLGGGALMGAGVATGLSAGICATVQAAQEEGIMTAEQVDQVLTRASQDLGSSEVVSDPAAMVGTADQCQSVMDALVAQAG